MKSLSLFFHCDIANSGKILYPWKTLIYCNVEEISPLAPHITTVLLVRDF